MPIMTVKSKAFLSFAIAAAIPFAVPAHVQAQTKLSGPVQIEAKRAELAQIQEQLADPDSLKRQATILTIVEAGDATKIDFALRIALVDSDASVRAIALRAYMANLKQLHFDIQSPPDIQRQLDAALNSDPERLADLLKRYPYLNDLQPGGYRLNLQFKNYSMSKNSGVAFAVGGESPFTVSGDRVTGRGQVLNNYGECAFDFQPQVLVRNSPPVLKGFLQCSRNNSASAIFFPRLTISAPMF
jgi:hypothetical protein